MVCPYAALTTNQIKSIQTTTNTFNKELRDRSVPNKAMDIHVQIIFTSLGGEVIMALTSTELSAFIYAVTSSRLLITKLMTLLSAAMTSSSKRSLSDTLVMISTSNWLLCSVQTAVLDKSSVAKRRCPSGAPAWRNVPPSGVQPSTKRYSFTVR